MQLRVEYCLNLTVVLLALPQYMGAPFEQIKRENVMELISYGFFYKER